VLNANGRPEGYKNLQRLRERIRPFLLRRRKADVEKELPDRTDRTVFVPMDPEQRARYAVHEERMARLVAQSRTRSLSKAESDRLQRELSMMRMLCDTRISWMMPAGLSQTRRNSGPVGERTPPRPA
jgi:SNF2 family DNA or RNA helicase